MKNLDQYFNLQKNILKTLTLRNYYWMVEGNNVHLGMSRGELVDLPKVTYPPYRVLSDGVFPHDVDCTLLIVEDSTSEVNRLVVSNDKRVEG